MSRAAIQLIRAAAMAKFGPLAGFAILAGSAYKLLAEGEGKEGFSLPAAANVFNELVGGKAAELFGACFENFGVDRNGDLERSMHAAAREAIQAIKSDAPEETGDWFEAWLRYLAKHGPDEVFTGTGETDPQWIHQDDEDFRAAWWAVMEPTLVRWGNTTGYTQLQVGAVRLPQPLADYVKRVLPDAMEKAHDHVLRNGEYSRSWIAVQQSNWETLFQLLRDDRRLGPTREEELIHLIALRDDCASSASLYSPLRATAHLLPKAERSAQPSLWANTPAIALLTHQKRKDVADAAPRVYSDILDAYGVVTRAAVLGAPGAGKSTTLRRLADSLAEKAIHDAAAPIPFFVALRAWSTLEPLDVFIGRKGIGWAANELSTRNRIVYLLDGLNEIPRDRIHAVAAFLQSVPKTVTVYVSCRQEDYTGTLDLQLDRLSIEPLTPAQIRAAVRRWAAAAGNPTDFGERFFWDLAGDQKLKGVFEKWMAAGASEDEFWKGTEVHPEAFKSTSAEEDGLWRRHVRSPRSLVKLAANPFLLTMLYTVWSRDPAQPALPANRGELFGLFVDCLEHRDRDIYRGDAEIPRKKLAALAWKMQLRTRGDESQPQVTLPKAKAIRILGGEPLLKRSLDSTVLDGSDPIYFRHQLLQEYFAAKALSAKLASFRADQLWRKDGWWKRNGWEETLVLLAGIVSEDCGPVVRWLADAQPEVAAQCILESGAEVVGKDLLLAELKEKWEKRLLPETAPEARAAIGRALARLDLDGRPGVGLANGLPDIAWVGIPDGPSPQFCMAKYLITKAQFQAFVDATDGYRDDRWWEGFSDPQRQAAAPGWSESNHPRETVSWHEAMAFCRWLSCQLGYEVTLPTEAQWERAASGGEEREYPWGSGYLPGAANINETYGNKGPYYLARTSPVGIYPEGRSDDGVLDMCGNVWEWCLNAYSDPRNVGVGGMESRALRGGSWINLHNFARVAFRYYFHPRLRYNNIGFRVVSLSPIRCTRAH